MPLNVAVRPEWVLRNTGDTPVTLGQPTPEVLEGCCPGPLSLFGSTIAPGGEATLTFELSMHEGMDSRHDIAVHVPVGSAGGTEVLTLQVSGDFRDTRRIGRPSTGPGRR